MEKQRQNYTLEIPSAYYQHYRRGTRAVLCRGHVALTERFTGKNHIYCVVDTLTGDTEKLFSRKAPLSVDEYSAVSDKMITSAIGQRYPADINPEEMPAPDSFESMSAELDAIFKHIMTKYGFGIRERQIELSRQMLDTLYHRRTLIAEAGLGIGKTYAYILASLMIKLRKTNEFWVRMNYKYSKTFSEKTRMPIVISTSSIALQKAIVTEYIPRVSDILTDCGFISAPLTCALRKGKEHYICDHSLVSFIGSKKGGGRPEIEGLLNNPINRIDMDEMDWLNPFERSRINVPNHCSRDCPDFGSCRYMELMNLYMTDKYDFQVCNHNYFIADTIRRNQKAAPLLPNYQAVIIDEAHKFLPAVRQMYGVSISNTEIEAFEEPLLKLKYEDKNKYDLMVSYYNTARRHCRYMFKDLASVTSETFEVTDRVKTEFRETALMSLRGMVYNLGRLKAILKENVSEPDLIYFKKLMGKLNDCTRRLEKFQHPGALICWLETPAGLPSGTGGILLSAIPSNLDKLLYNDFWMKSIPKIITSGTLAVGGDFSFTKSNLGLDQMVPDRLVEVVKPSPFNYREHCLLYISEKIPFPMPPDDSSINGYKEYLDAITEEIGQLILSTNGHTAVLFTSYQVMGAVYSRLRQNGIPYPVFKMNKGDVSVITRFRNSGNGVLLAAGSFWEGVDLPGDILSSLIIVKLPFATPDPVNEYERSLCDNDEEYKEKYIFADMVIRLMQGIGRLIRSETDTGVICILDSRMKPRGKYRVKVLASLLGYRVTNKIQDIRAFLRKKKPREFFN